MKRYGKLWDKIIDKENIKLAHKMARKDKTYYSEVKYVDEHLEDVIDKIHNMLKNKTYKIKAKDYIHFVKWDKTKYRDIYKLDYFPHRIIQWAILLQTQDIFMSSLISQTYASLPNRGIHKGLFQLRNYLNDKENTKYCLKFDIHHFYPSINREILKKLLRKKFKDNNLLWIFDLIIDSMEGDKGIAIGSLCSQYFGNFYLTYFDHWIKEHKHIKYYLRYCDDVVILSNDKHELQKLLDDIVVYLKENLDLDLKSNFQIFPTDIRGIDFLGYRSYRNYTILRKSTYKNFKRKMLRISKLYNKYENITFNQFCTVNSYLGWLKFCNCENLINKYIINTKLNLACNQYRLNIKNKKQIKRWDRKCEEYYSIIQFLNEQDMMKEGEINIEKSIKY